MALQVGLAFSPEEGHPPSDLDKIKDQIVAKQK